MRRLLPALLVIIAGWSGLVACDFSPVAPGGVVTGDSAYVVVAGDTTWYKRAIFTTSYSTKLVIDTSYVTDSMVVRRDVTDSMVVASAVASGGIAAGLTQWPQDKWPGGPLNGTRLPMNPNTVLSDLQAARGSGLRVSLNLRRAKMTANGRTDGCYSQSKAFAEVDANFKVLSPAAVAGYAQDGTLIDLMAIDEPQSGTWCGQAIPWPTVAALTKYVKSKWPAMPVMVRSVPSVLDDYSGWGGSLDVGVVVWNTKRGPTYVTIAGYRVKDPKGFWDAEWSHAQKLGIAMETSVNAAFCSGTNTSPCPADLLLAVSKIALDHPATCAMLDYTYTDPMWSRADLRTTWKAIADYARTKPTRSCRRS